MRLSKAARVLPILVSLLVGSVVVAAMGLRAWFLHQRYIGPEDAQAYLETHRPALEQMVREFNDLPQVQFVVAGGTGGYNMLVRLNDSSGVYFAAAPVSESRDPLWLTSFDRIRDKQAGMTLQELLDTASMSNQQFIQLVQSLDSLELYGITRIEPGSGVFFRIRELTGVAYGPTVPQDAEGYGMDSTLHLGHGWYWFKDIW